MFTVLVGDGLESAMCDWLNFTRGDSDVNVMMQYNDQSLYKIRE